MLYLGLNCHIAAVILFPATLLRDCFGKCT
jgi:hypothetical protein